MKGMIGEQELLEKQCPGKTERLFTLANVFGSKQLHRTAQKWSYSYGKTVVVGYAIKRRLAEANLNAVA